MEYYDKEYCLEVWGPYACFTRPEFKVERVSYDVITPSAARAVFEAIFWKPAVRWEVLRIEVLEPVRWFSVRRNEVGAVAGRNLSPILIEDKRQQKNALVLKDVRYRIHARMVYLPPRLRAGESARAASPDENPKKYQEMFERRAGRGQCFSQPYLGTREFSAFFRLVGPDDAQVPPVAEDRDLGFMLYDMDFSRNADNPDAMFFRAQMRQGVVDVPPRDSNEILR